MRADSLLRPTPAGLYCEPGGFYIDPVKPVDRAVITHGHSDHARAGHAHVLATPETLAIMRARYGENCAGAMQALPYGEEIRLNDVRVRLAPAGHVLGSAQVAVEAAGVRIVASGDYKRGRDPSCAAFEPVPADVFITEATFGLPVFRHPPPEGEIAKLLSSLARNPDRAHLVGAYALGKAQRLILLLREAGYDRPIFIHGALKKLCDLYERFGVALGPLEPATVKNGPVKRAFAGEIVLGPPSAFSDKWARRFADPLVAFASGWMRVKARARQRGAELPLILSDHADWDELTATIGEVTGEELWVTHGREEALVHHARSRGLTARPLSLVGYEDEAD